MRLALLVEPVDGPVDCTVEIIGIDEGVVDEVVAFEVAPATLDLVQLRRILRQPLDGEPRPVGERLGRDLAGVDRAVIHDDDQRLVALSDAAGRAEVIEQIDEIGRALAGTGTDKKPAVNRIEGAQHGAPFSLTGGLDAKLRATSGPAMSQVGMGACLGLVEKEEIDHPRGCLRPQVCQAVAAGGDRLGILTGFQRMPWPAPAEPLCRSWIESQPSEIVGPPRRSISARRRGRVQPRSWRWSSPKIVRASAAAALPIRLGRPGGLRRLSAATPPLANRPRHARTVLTCTRRVVAISAARRPSSVSRIARAWSASTRCPERASKHNAVRASASAVILDRPATAHLSQLKDRATLNPSPGFGRAA